jgi:hypothetical protein
MSNNVKATLLLRDRVVLSERAFADIRIWRVPSSVRGSAHDLKYSLALVVDRICVLRYDNEAGKGDHRHTVEGGEEPYLFSGAEALVEDFWEEVDAWMTKRSL